MYIVLPARRRPFRLLFSFWLMRKCVTTCLSKGHFLEWQRFFNFSLQVVYMRGLHPLCLCIRHMPRFGESREGLNALYLPPTPTPSCMRVCGCIRSVLLFRHFLTTRVVGPHMSRFNCFTCWTQSVRTATYIGVARSLCCIV